MQINTYIPFAKTKCAAFNRGKTAAANTVGQTDTTFLTQRKISFMDNICQVYRKVVSDFFKGRLGILLVRVQWWNQLKRRVHKQLTLILADKRAQTSNLHHSEANGNQTVCLVCAFTEDVSWVGGLSAWPRTQSRTHCRKNLAVRSPDLLRMWSEGSDLNMPWVHSQR